MTLREVNRMGEGQKNVPKLRFKGYVDAWEQRKFGDVGTVAMCKRIFKEETSENGEVPFYKIGTFGGEPDAYISREVYEKYKTMYPYPKKGDILISASGSIGRTVEYTGKDEYFQDSNIVWLQHNKNIDNSFLKVLYSVVQWSCEGSTIKRLYNDNFLKTKIVIPNIKEQMLIGEYFGRLDNLITLHQRKYDALKTMKKTLLSKMFPKDGEDVPEIRFKGFTDAWEQRRLEEIFLKIRNAFVGTSTPYYVEKNQGGHFYIESNNVKHGQINHDTEVFINEEFYQNQKDKWLKTGDIVMVQSGHVGHSAVIPEYLNNSAAHALIMFQEYLIETNPNFINFQFQTESVRNKIDSITTGNTIKHILASDMKLFSISNTQKKEADKLGDFFISLDNLITLHQRKLDELKNMKKTLLQQMFV